MEPTLLVVSDDSALLDVATEWGCLRGLQVAVAGTVAEACRALRRSRPALTLCSARLPDGPGTAMVLDLLAVHEDALAIMVCHSEAGQAEGEAGRARGASVYECVCSGALDVAVWPIDVAGLDELVRAALERVGRDLVWTERTTGISVLCVEDDPITLRFTGKLLDTYGVRAILVPSLAEARRALGREVPDLVILDLFLNAESGLELLDECRRRWPLLPVIVVTASHKLDVLLDALRAGAAAVLVKPLERERLRAIITQLYRTKRHRETINHLERALGEARRREERRLDDQGLAMLGMIASSVIDEMSSPVEHALTTVELVLRDPELPAKARQGLERTRTGLQRVGHLSRQVARLLTRSAESTRCDVHQALGECLRFAERRYLMGSVELEPKLEAAWSLVMAAPAAVECLFLLLLLDLCERLPAGDRLQVMTVNHMAVLEVRLHGSLPASAGAGPPSATLAHVQGIARRLGAALHVDGSDGQPHRATVRLRCPTAEERRGFVVTRGEAPWLQRLASEPPLAVGIVTASDGIAEECAGWIGAAGMQAERLESALRALARGPGEPPDLLVIDATSLRSDEATLLRDAAPVVLLLEEGLPADGIDRLGDLANHVTVARPLCEERLVQALALAELAARTAPGTRDGFPTAAESGGRTTGGAS